MSRPESDNMASSRRTVVIAGATGYLGRFFASEYQQRGWKVKALSRRSGADPKGIFAEDNVRVVQAQVTDPSTLRGIMFVDDPPRAASAQDDRVETQDKKVAVDLVVSCVGITRQQDGLTYRDVDFRANVNLLQEALRAGVPRFVYIHVLGGDTDPLVGLPAVAAKHDFAEELRAATATIKPTVISPSGFFSDMQDFYDMARQGRVWLFGPGNHRINPIHGADLAKATVDAIEQDRSSLEIGGPDIFTAQELAELAFECNGKPPKIVHLWDGLRKLLIALLPWITPLYIHGPAVFFLTAMGQDMVGECHGTHHLRDHFLSLRSQEQD